MPLFYKHLSKITTSDYYEDLNDHDQLRHDPLLGGCLHKASRQTPESRFWAFVRPPEAPSANSSTSMPPKNAKNRGVVRHAG